MSALAEAFLDEWVHANVRPTSQDSAAAARSLTSRCFAEATQRGIDPDELDSIVGGNLERYFANRVDSLPAPGVRQAPRNSVNPGWPELLFAFAGGMVLARTIFSDRRWSGN